MTSHMEAFHDVFVDSLRVSIDRKREADRFRPLEYDSQCFKQLNSVPDVISAVRLPALSGVLSSLNYCTVYSFIYWEGFLHGAK